MPELISRNLLAAIFFAAWIALAIASIAFHFRWDAARKRKFWPVIVIIGGVLFSVFLGLTAPPAFLVIAIPAIVLITFGNLRTMKFCGVCNASAYSQNPFAPYRHCPKCGSPL